MALSQSSLSAQIVTQIEAEFGSVADDPTRLKDFADAIAKAVVDEITANAVVTVTGVQSGGSNATGTIT